MKCEKCGTAVTKTLSDNCVSRVGRHKTTAYYCGHCDEIFILDKYKDIIDKHKYDGELSWLRDSKGQ